MAAAIALPFHPGLARYTWHDQFFMCPLADDLEADFAFDEIKAFMRAQNGRKIGFNMLLREGAKAPTPACRARTREQMNRLEPGVSHTATLIMGAGFFASLFLGVAGTMMRMRHSEVPRLLTQKMPEFAECVARHSRCDVSSFEVLSTTNWILHEVAARRQEPMLRATG